ncbi:SGNH/GDSL hydrolase family protein [Caulobacter soli]|uniref:SGNH/GDSL hydrolase family protein n=1 Tax=Caulobacter soli TaxID=2708539 RepID=UPI0013EADB25|nr:SGNH/GDSL hydrolase family protein [Caulobacter soli]
MRAFRPYKRPNKVLPAMTFNAALNIPTGATQGTLLATLTNPFPGETLTLDPDDGRRQWVGNQLQVGPTPGALSDAFNLVRSHPWAATPTVTSVVANFGGLPRFQAALRDAIAGARGPVRIAGFGDSKLRGSGAGTGTFFNTGAAIVCKLVILAKALTTAGLQTSWSSVFGNSNFSNLPGFKDFDPRITGASDWTLTATKSLGGFMWTTTTATSLVFTPQTPVKTLEVHTLLTGDDGSFTITRGADPTPLATVVPPTPVAAATELITTVDLGAPSTDPIQIQRIGGGALAVIGLDGYGPDDKVRIANFSVGGAKSADAIVSDTGYATLTAALRYAPDLGVINLGANDVVTTSGVTTAAYLGRIQTLVTALKGAGADVILTWPAISTIASNGTEAHVADFKDGLKALAATNSAVFIDETVLLGGRVAATADGRFVDGVHDSLAANQIEENPLFDLLWWAYVNRG